MIKDCVHKWDPEIYTRDPGSHGTMKRLLHRNVGTRFDYDRGALRGVTTVCGNYAHISCAVWNDVSIRGVEWARYYDLCDKCFTPLERLSATDL